MRRLRLDDPRWRPLADIYQLRRQQTGSPTLAASDMTEALAQGRIHCMWRKIDPQIPGPDRVLVAPEIWTEYEVQGWSDGVLIAPRRRSGGWRVVTPIGGLAFFLWGPDVAKAWISKTEAKTEAKTDSKGGRPQIQRVTKEAIEAEIKRRLKAGEPTDHKTLARHFPCSQRTIRRRLSEKD